LKQVVVGSLNPVKIECIRQAFAEVFPGEAFEVLGLDAPSGVSDQPMNARETYRGALNRARSARRRQPGAGYWVGIEGGIDRRKGIMEAYAWIVILSDGLLGRARTATFQLPPAVAALVEQGMELGHADDLVFGRSNSKQHNGAVGLLTHDRIDRTAYYKHAAVLALIPFLHPSLYSPASHGKG
jgi:inosine/xanthosine triphosphatase